MKMSGIVVDHVSLVTDESGKTRRENAYERINSILNMIHYNEHIYDAIQIINGIKKEMYMIHRNDSVAVLAPFLHLPVDVFTHILDFAISTDGYEIVEMSTVCKLFRSLIFREGRDRDDGLPNYSHIRLHSSHLPFAYTHVGEIRIDIRDVNRNDTTFSCDTLILHAGGRYHVTDRLVNENISFITCNTLILDRMTDLFNCDLHLFDTLPSRLIINDTIFENSTISMDIKDMELDDMYIFTCPLALHE